MKFDDRLYVVYMHVNKINGKRYIGISHNYENRWRNGSGYKLHVFGKAIQKYGWDNFEHIIVAENLCLEDAKQMEIELIKKYKSKVHENGYNVRSGGDLQDNLYIPILQFSPEGFFIKRHDGISLAAEEMHISPVDILGACQGKTKTCCGFIWKYESDINDIDAFCESINPLDYTRYISIHMFDLDGNYLKSFDNQFEAAKYINPNNPKSDPIRKCCLRQCKSAHGFIWRYAFEIPNVNGFKFSDEFITLFWKDDLIVYEFDRDGNYIQSYASSQQAGEIKGVSASSITYACNHHTLSCNSQWRRKKEYPQLHITPYKRKRRIVLVGQFDENHNLVRIFDNPLQVQEELGIKNQTISTAICKNVKSHGFYWEHIEQEKEVS